MKKSISDRLFGWNHLTKIYRNEFWYTRSGLQKKWYAPKYVSTFENRTQINTLFVCLFFSFSKFYFSIKIINLLFLTHCFFMLLNQHVTFFIILFPFNPIDTFCLVLERLQFVYQLEQHLTHCKRKKETRKKVTIFFYINHQHWIIKRIILWQVKTNLFPILTQMEVDFVLNRRVVPLHDVDHDSHTNLLTIWKFYSSKRKWRKLNCFVILFCGTKSKCGMKHQMRNGLFSRWRESVGEFR